MGVLLNDTFDSPNGTSIVDHNPKYYLYDGSTGEISDGKLYLSGGANMDYIETVEGDFEAAFDFDFDSLGGSELDFRLYDGADYVMWWIKTFQVQIVWGPPYWQTVNIMAYDALSGVHRIKVTKVGSTYSFYIDDVLIDSGAFGNVSPVTKFGFNDQSQSCSIDNFTITIPDPAPETNIKKAGGVLYANLKKLGGVAVANIKKMGGVQ